MNLYIDESGNTGEAAFKNGNFNFIDQPYYVLSGILLNNNQEIELEKFIKEKKKQYHLQGDELKAKNLYESKFKFIDELVEFIIVKDIPFFIELVEKRYYMNVQIQEHIIMPTSLLPITDELLYKKKFLASSLGKWLDDDVYKGFIETVQAYSDVALEQYYQYLIDYFNDKGFHAITDNIILTRDDYREEKKEHGQEALIKFLPVPDKNPHGKLVYLLPNYGSLTNLIARAQKYIDDNYFNEKINIIHDEQKQFDIIYKEALELMKITDTDELIKETVLISRSRFNIDKDIYLTFLDSKKSIPLQIADLISGTVNRIWADYKNGNSAIFKKYRPIISKLHYPKHGSSIGINYVTSD